MFRIVGRSFMLIDGSRNIVMTCAFEKSVANRSAWTKVALSDTPAVAAFFLARFTMSGLYSTPCARAPRLAAVITVRPSPDPRSMTKSCGVTLALSSILSTSACGVGTQTTSLPAWPTFGSNGCDAVCVACADGCAANSEKTAEQSTTRVRLRRCMIRPPGRMSKTLDTGEYTKKADSKVHLRAIPEQTDRRVLIPRSRAYSRAPAPTDRGCDNRVEHHRLLATQATQRSPANSRK